MEIRKDIPGYDGKYKISNLGNLLNTSFNKKRIIKPVLSNKKYYLFNLYKEYKYKSISAHRLVAQAFLGLDINNKQMLVCHKDDNPLNNKVENLFLGTHMDNMQDCINKGRFVNNIKNLIPNKNKKVCQMDLQGKHIKIWDSGKEIREKMGISTISCCCLGKRKTAGGFMWKYV